MAIQLSSPQFGLKQIKKLETNLIHYTVMSMDFFPHFSKCGSLRQTLWEDQGTMTGMLRSNKMTSSLPHKRTPGVMDALGEWVTGGAGGTEVRTVVSEPAGHCSTPGKPAQCPHFNT